MICLICGKNYISVGVHAKHKHGITADEYRHQFGMMKTTPLVDDDLSLHLSRTARITFATRDRDEQEEIRERCRDNRAKHGCPKGAMSDAGVAALGSRNKARNEAYLGGKSGAVAAVIEGSSFALDARRELGVGHSAVVAMARAGLISYDRDKAETARLAKVARSIEKRREPQIASVIALYDSKLTLAEICKSTGIGLTTYKKWRASGLVPDRKTCMKSSYPEFPDS